MKVLLLCTSHNDLGLIRGLRKLGCEIVATGNRDSSPGEKLVDRWIRADYSDKEAILSIAREEKIDAICPCCNDFGVYTAAYVAEKMNLPGHDDFETTLKLHNKDRFKVFAAQHQIHTPKAHYYKDGLSAIEGISQLPMPVIIKPVDASAGNGISKVTEKKEIEVSVKNAFDKSREKRIVAEPFVDGTQHGFCAFLVNRKVVAFCTNNEYSFINPFRVEIDTYPADNWEKCYDQLVEQIERIADVLELKDGIFHLQYIYQNGEAWIIEVMRRVLGNMYSVPANQLTGIDWDYWEARARCGLNCDDFPKPVLQQGCYAYKEIMSTCNGRIRRIQVPKEYEKYIYDEFWLMKEGDMITDYMREPIGFLFMMFRDQNEMRRILISGYRSDTVQIG